MRFTRLSAAPILPAVFFAGIMLTACSGLFAQGRRIPTPQPNQNPSAGPSYMRMRVEEERITAELRAVPLQQVLVELAARTGLVFEVGSQENDPVSISLYRVSLAEAVQRLVGNNNSIFYYGQDESGRSRIRFVRILSRANNAPQPSLHYIGTGVPTKGNDDTIDTPEQALKVLGESANVEARQKAVEVLVAAKGEVAIQALSLAVDDPAPEVKVAAIEGLASLGVRAVLPQVLKCLKDSHPGVRQSAVVAVALLGDAENLKDLRPLGRDPDASVAAAAEIAIKKLSVRRP